MKPPVAAIAKRDRERHGDGQKRNWHRGALAIRDDEDQHEHGDNDAADLLFR